MFPSASIALLLNLVFWKFCGALNFLVNVDLVSPIENAVVGNEIFFSANVLPLDAGTGLHSTLLDSKWTFVVSTDVHGIIFEDGPISAFRQRFFITLPPARCETVNSTEWEHRTITFSVVDRSAEMPPIVLFERTVRVRRFLPALCPNTTATLKWPGGSLNGKIVTWIGSSESEVDV